MPSRAGEESAVGHSTQHAVERQVRAVLAADPLARVLDVPGEQASAEESLAWAQDATQTLATAHDRYRPVAPVWYWGRVLEPSSSIPSSGKSPA